MAVERNQHKSNVTSLYPKENSPTNKKSSARNRLHNLIVNGIILLMITFSVICIVQIMRAKVQINDMNTQVEKARDSLTSEQQAVAALQNQANLLKNDEYVAKLARSRYYLSKENEIIFSIPEDNDSKQAEVLNEIYLKQQTEAKAQINS